MFATTLFFCFVSWSIAQQVGTLQAENHPALTSEVCTSKGNCQSQSTSVVLDSNWRWTHSVSGSTNCYTGNTWDSTLCPDPDTCASNCAIDGADYPGTYGITTSGDTLRLNFVTHGPYSTNIGSRVYLMESDSEYQMFKLRNMEFAFDVDVSQLPCGLNGALYFVEMPQDGGAAKYPSNKAGAKYGTGYCDAQCPHDLKWIDGEANLLDWQPSPVDPNSGTGKYGTCCIEMDIWEANSMATAYTAHPCSVIGPYRCSGTQCGDGDNRYGGVCDKDGCDFNAYRLGNTTFFERAINPSQPFTVVTQFPADGTGTINRIYVQNGKVIPNPYTKNLGSGTSYNSISTDFCNKEKQVFGDKNDFAAKGGLDQMLKSFDNGMVLVMSLWDDYAAHMLWLDSDYPLTKPASQPGVARGSCATDSGVPAKVQADHPNAYVKFSKIRFGPHGSTY